MAVLLSQRQLVCVGIVAQVAVQSSVQLSCQKRFAVPVLQVGQLMIQKALSFAQTTCVTEASSVVWLLTGAQSSTGAADVPGLDEGSYRADGLWGHSQPRHALQLRGDTL